MIIAGIGAGALLSAVVVLLALVLAELQVSREHIESQDAKISALLDTTEPALDDVPGLVRRADPVLRAAAPLLRAVSGGEVNDAAGRLGTFVSSASVLVGEAVPLVRSLTAGGLGDAAARANQLMAQLEANDLIDSTAGLVNALSTGDRLTDTLDAGKRLIDQIEALSLPRRALASSNRLHELLDTQKRTFDVLVQSKGLQVKLLRHTRSIDRRLGAFVPIVP